MRHFYISLLVFPTVLLAGGIYPNEVITVDPVSPKFQKYPFIDEDLQRQKDLPTRSDVEILNQTLKNSSSGKRIFTEKISMRCMQMVVKENLIKYV